MDRSAYKDLQTYRGMHYHYFSIPAVGSKPTLLFLHGFPSTSFDWRYQVSYFKKKGYGLIVPDMLGYGGSDKPLEPEHYKASLLCQDMTSILDNEGVDKVIVIGHDLGSRIVSRLASYYPERFTAYAFLSIGYTPPMPKFDMHQALQMTKQRLGYELYGYWMFFSAEGADRIVDNHWDSFFSLVYPHDPTLWRTDLAPLGCCKAWLLANKTGPLPPYLSPEDKQIMSTLLRPLTGALNWYKVMTGGVQAADDRSVAPYRYSLPPTAPVLFVGCEKDYIGLVAAHKAATEKCAGEGMVRTEVFDSDHWVMFSHAERLNKLLEEWIGDAMRRKAEEQEHKGEANGDSRL
ncbi:epoxide hydrolase [Gloeophyllum trabeum ATCC 11539]|uniref:Epoxide hydrolase n=1 Tax=Gloeophyllum trabeum (strain ATCC 11539 / FP-39264 / Madison 617) TaxID=670483 RepID=S7QM93_GLOTA|nr:epoxide hydrolase [Gloeophyllum trabeum ATCC 11539]EPQ60583.1 epoxide hydrolase [Gloeophyllum trabeum ATCC 11539]